jgi:uroporphyrinogen decarboxylase
MMTRRERFMAAVQVKQPDRVPMFDFLFQQPMYEKLLGRRPKIYNAKDAIPMALALDHDAVWLPFGGYNGFQPRYLTDDTYIDEWGTTYRTTEYAWPIDAPVDYPIKSREDWRNYKSPDPTMAGRADDILDAVAMERDNLVLAPGITGPFTTCWLLMGYEKICYSLYDDPELLTEIFQMSNDYNKEAARLAVQAGGEAIWLGDDLGDSRSGFMNLKQFRKYYLPYLADLAEYVTNLGVPLLLHCCGHFKPYLPDLAQTTISAIHPMQRTANMDLRWVKENYGQRFCLIGNIDSSRTLPYGTPEEVIAEVEEAIDIAAPGGGYVLASDHSLHDGISVENILAMFRTGREYGEQVYAKQAA